MPTMSASFVIPRVLVAQEEQTTSVCLAVELQDFIRINVWLLVHLARFSTIIFASRALHHAPLAQD